MKYYDYKGCYINKSFVSMSGSLTSANNNIIELATFFREHPDIWIAINHNIYQDDDSSLSWSTSSEPVPMTESFSAASSRPSSIFRPPSATTSRPSSISHSPLAAPLRPSSIPAPPAAPSPPAPVVHCLMCYKKTTNTDKLCSDSCKKYYNERCMYCCNKLPEGSIDCSLGKFCNESKCYSEYAKFLHFGHNYRKCTCGAYVCHDKIPMYINGYIHCDLKCKKSWDEVQEKPKSTSTTVYSGWPFPTGWTIPVGVRVGTKFVV